MSFLIYLFIYLISFIFAYFAEKKLNKNKKLFYFLSFIAILIPSLFAGFRDSGVGTDTQVYVDKFFNIAQNYNSLVDYYEHVISTGLKPFYIIITYLAKMLGDDVNILYFLLSFITMFFVYLACFRANKMNNKLSISFAYLTFMVLFYNKIFNICRQSIAVAIMLSATIFLIDNKWKKYLIYLFVAWCFHDSALLCLPLLIVSYLLKQKKSILFTISSLFTILLVVVLYRQVIQYLIDSGMLNSYYSKYIEYNGSNILLPIFFIILLVVLFLVLQYKKLININFSNKLYLYFVTLGLLVYCVGFFSMYSQRIAYYYLYYLIFLIPQLKLIFKVRDYKFVNFFVLFCLLVFNYIYYVNYEIDRVYPYKSEILHIRGGDR